jgi:hypothetical protein
MNADKIFGCSLIINNYVSMDNICVSVEYVNRYIVFILGACDSIINE